MKLLKKITVKTVRGKKFEGFDKADAIGTEKTLMTVYGRVDSMVDGKFTMPNGDVSEFTKFKGSFAAIDDNGVESRAGLMILPDVAQDLLTGMLGAEGVSSINFGFRINVRKNETPIGYEYTAEPLFESDAADPLTAIRASLPAGVLPAPAAPTAFPAPASAPPATEPAKAPGKRNSKGKGESRPSA